MYNTIFLQGTERNTSVLLRVWRSTRLKSNILIINDNRCFRFPPFVPPFIYIYALRLVETRNNDHRSRSINKLIIHLRGNIFFLFSFCFSFGSFFVHKFFSNVFFFFKTSNRLISPANIYTFGIIYYTKLTKSERLFRLFVLRTANFESV